MLGSNKCYGGKFNRGTRECQDRAYVFPVLYTVVEESIGDSWEEGKGEGQSDLDTP